MGDQGRQAFEHAMAYWEVATFGIPFERIQRIYAGFALRKPEVFMQWS